MLTAGEALHIKSEEWVRDAVIAGIKETGKHPPLIVRQWTIDPYRFRDVIKPNYDQLYTMMKHNTEMIVSPYPDPRNSTWISFGQNHIINVHENGDIKPFRWGSPVFIQQMVRIWTSMGVAGMHLYPAVSWDWPVSLDRTEPSLASRPSIVIGFGSRRSADMPGTQTAPPPAKSVSGRTDWLDASAMRPREALSTTIT
jgi:hypothetical protein